MSIQQIIEKALEKAQAAQAVILTQEADAISFKNDRLKSAESSQRTQIDVKVIVNGKVGFSNTTDPQDIVGVVKHALEAAKFGSPAHFDFSDAQALEPVKIYDPELVSLEKAEMICMGQQMMDRIRSYNSEILSEANIHKTVFNLEYANSRGVNYTAKHTDFNVSAGGHLVRGTDIFFAGHCVGQKKRNIDTEGIAAQAIEYFRMAENSAPIESGEMQVIFTPFGLIALLLSLGLAVDGKNVLLGASPLRDKLGRLIAGPGLTIVDNPFIEYGTRTSAFDDEGTPRKITPLIEKGVLRNFIYDRDTAGRAGVKPTGHGSNRHLTNLIIDPGDTVFKTMLANTRHGLLVHDFLGLGQGNPINGDFSVNVFLGYKIENGELVGRVKDVMLSGNAFDALKDITAISREREEVSGSWAWYAGLMPYVQVSKLSVTAK